MIFANPDGTPFKPDSVSAAVSLLFRRLKLPKGASLHSLRHSPSAAEGSRAVIVGVIIKVPWAQNGQNLQQPTTLEKSLARREMLSTAVVGGKSRISGLKP